MSNLQPNALLATQEDMPSPPVIELQHASVIRGTSAIWQDVSLTVYAGECIAILGQNGSGKSTLLKTILGLLPIEHGAIRILGTSPHRGNPAIGYVPQRHSLDPDIRIRARDFVRLGLDGARWGMPVPFIDQLVRGKAQIDAEERLIDQALERVGALHLAQRTITEMSGGEQQRIFIAQAIVTSPRILLLDEPLEGLDMGNQQTTVQLINDIARQDHTAVLMVAHDVNPIMPYVDRILFLCHNTTVIGTPEEVVTAEILSKIYGVSIQVLKDNDRTFVIGMPDPTFQHRS